MTTIELIALVGLIGFGCQWLAWRLRLPAIVFFLLAGIILGPLTGILKPDEIFGDLLFPLVSLAVAIILFEGSLTLKFSELPDISKIVFKLVTTGALINAGITSLVTHYCTGLSWSLSWLFGAIMVVTGPTVIMPMLRTVKPIVQLARVLRWEGIVIDPLGAIFALLIYEWIVVQHFGGTNSHVVWMFLRSVLTGVITGASMGYLFGTVLRQHWLPDYLHNFAAVALVAGTFAFCDAFAHESGLLAVTVMGVWLANMRDVHIDPILDFKESLTVIFVSSLFIILAARLDLGGLKELGWSAVAVLFAMQFISRPIKVCWSTLGTRLNWRERALLAWIGPRGIVAAAVSALFALRLEQLEIAGAEYLVPLAFAVIIGTVVIQGATARPLARTLGVTNPDVGGHLIIGANLVARTIAEALQHAGVNVVLCDNYWDNIRAAREKGLPVYYGNPISEHAKLNIDLTAFRLMIGLSHHTERNISAALRYREEFGYRALYVLPTADDRNGHAKHEISVFYRGQTLFDGEAGYGKLASMISQGAEIRKTRLTDTFTLENWQAHYRDIPKVVLFAIDLNKRVQWYTTRQQPKPKEGWVIYTLCMPESGPAGGQST